MRRLRPKKWLKQQSKYFILNKESRLMFSFLMFISLKYLTVFVGSRACAANHYVITEKCPVCNVQIFGDFAERRLRIRYTFRKMP